MANYISKIPDGETVDALLTTVQNSNLSATHKITRSATIVVAASDSSEKSKAQADYVCDGINDEVEILNAVADIGTGTVYLTSGNFVCSGLPIKTGLSYRGAGDSSTVLRLPSGATNGMFVASGAEAINGGGIYDLAIDGSNAPTFNGIDFGASAQLSEFHIERCYIHNLNHGYHGSLDDRFCPIVDCKIYNNDVGVYVVNNHPHLKSCNIIGNVIGLGGTPYDMSCDSSRFDYNTYGVKGVNLGDVNACFFTNCTFYNNTEIGIDIGSDCTIVGCQIGGPVSKIGVSISGTYSTISGCSFRSDGSVGPMVYFTYGRICNGTVISSNSFHTPSADVIMSGTGAGYERWHISIIGNIIRTNKHAISFPNGLVYGVISNNTIEFNGNIGTDPLIYLPSSGVGSCVVTNNVLYSPVADACGPGILIDARSSIIMGNRLRSVGEIVTTQTNDNTVIEHNICTYSD
jgi:hypothetical protein